MLFYSYIDKASLNTDLHKESKREAKERVERMPLSFARTPKEPEVSIPRYADKYYMCTICHWQFCSVLMAVPLTRARAPTRSKQAMY